VGSIPYAGLEIKITKRNKKWQQKGKPQNCSAALAKE